ncbi:MAG: HAMP domain-containing sensor histidine kinase [Gemmatimonadaceae bacterium]
MEDEEERLLRLVALRNADSIFLARQRAEQELVRLKDILEGRTEALARSLEETQAMLEERDRARADADAARIAAQAANEAKSRFVSMVSHELRTPLGAIGGYAALLDEGIHGELSDEQRQFVARIRRNQQHLLRLADELLDLARIESGQFPLELDGFAVQLVVESVRQMIEPQIQARDLRFEVLAFDDTLSVLADRERVDQIALNLVANAVKFTPPGGTITISATAAGKDVFLQVQDTGPGIQADKLEEVFKPFVQIDSRHGGISGGTGLGLAISRELARAMGGALSAESDQGKGSTFTLCLPRLE